MISDTTWKTVVPERAISEPETHGNQSVQIEFPELEMEDATKEFTTKSESRIPPVKDSILRLP